MAGNFVKLAMLAYNKRTEAQFAVDLLALGVRKGREVSVDKRVPAGGLRALLQQLQHKGARRMTFTWYPPDGQKTLFQMLRKDTLDFDITAGLYGDNSRLVWELSFTLDNIHIADVLQDVPGRPNAQRVETTLGGNRGHANRRDVPGAHSQRRGDRRALRLQWFA